MNKKKKYPFSFKKKSDTDDICEEVYAGPGYFGGEEDPVDEPVEEPANEPADTEEQEPYIEEPPRFRGIGKGRAVPPPPEMIMCVYAGPEYFNRPADDTPRGQYLSPEEIAEMTEKDAEVIPDDGKHCPFCGTERIPGSQFCHECGAPLPETGENDG